MLEVLENASRRIAHSAELARVECTDGASGVSDPIGIS